MAAKKTPAERDLAVIAPATDLDKIADALLDYSVRDVVAFAVAAEQDATRRIIAAGLAWQFVKDNCRHGEFEGLAREAGKSPRHVRRLMEIYHAFKSDPLGPICDLSLSFKQLHALTALSPDERETLAGGGEVRGVTLDKVAEMGGRQLSLLFKEHAHPAEQQLLDANERERRLWNNHQRTLARVRQLEGELAALKNPAHNPLPTAVAMLAEQVEALVALVERAAADNDGAAARVRGSVQNSEARRQLKKVVALVNRRLGAAAARIERAAAGAGGE